MDVLIGLLIGATAATAMHVFVLLRLLLVLRQMQQDIAALQRGTPGAQVYVYPLRGGRTGGPTVRQDLLQ